MASSDNAEHKELVPTEVLQFPSVEQMEVDPKLEIEPERESWMTPLKSFLVNGTLPTKKSERRAVIRKASRYVLQGNVLYRQGFSMPLLWCIAYEDIKRVLKEAHEGECGDHTGGKRWQRRYCDMAIFGLP